MDLIAAALVAPGRSPDWLFEVVVASWLLGMLVLIIGIARTSGEP